MHIKFRTRYILWTSLRLLIASGLLLLVLPLSIAAAISVPGSWTKYTGNPVFNPAGAGSWEANWIFDPSVLYDGSTYRMWYTGSEAVHGIGYATSPDGLTWTRVGTSPVLTGTAASWDAVKVRFAAVISDTGQYKMWYTGRGSTGGYRIGYATSTNGSTWNKSGSPVLDVGAAGAWDVEAVDMPAVIKVGSTYQLWYHGRNGATGGIGCATSSNGVAWTKCTGNPVFGGGGAGSWDYAVYAPTVLYDGGVYRMWYSGCDASGTVCSTGYATSSDGLHWSRQTLALPQGAAGAFDGYSADYPTVLRVGNTYQMWYSGIDASQTYRIGYATAPMLNLDKSVYLPAVLKPPGTPLPPPVLKVPTYIPTSIGESHEP